MSHLAVNARTLPVETRQAKTVQSDATLEIINKLHETTRIRHRRFRRTWNSTTAATDVLTTKQTSQSTFPAKSLARNRRIVEAAACCMKKAFSVMTEDNVSSGWTGGLRFASSKPCYDVW